VVKKKNNNTIYFMNDESGIRIILFPEAINELVGLEISLSLIATPI